jgi:hypothetical protein
LGSLSDPTCAAESRTLSGVDTKNAEFVREAFFRQAWEDSVSVLGAHSAARTFQQVAAVLFKPESVVGGRVLLALDFLARHGFVPIVWQWVAMDRLAINTIWRFQWNVATMDRLDIAQVLYCHGDSLLVFFRDKRRDPQLPAAVHLRTLKGPAEPEQQAPHHLRHVIRSPNRTMSMVHAPDEPIDIVRELAILLDRPERLGVIERLRQHAAADYSIELRAAVRQRMEVVGHHDLEWWTGIRGYADAAGVRDLARAEATLRRVVEAETLGRGARPPRVWPALCAHFDQVAPTLGTWNRLVIGTSLVCHDEPGAVCTIDDDGVAEWRAGLGRMMPNETSADKWRTGGNA